MKIGLPKIYEISKKYPNILIGSWIMFFYEQFQSKALFLFDISLLSLIFWPLICTIQQNLWFIHDYNVEQRKRRFGFMEWFGGIYLRLTK